MRSIEDLRSRIKAHRAQSGRSGLGVELRREAVAQFSSSGMSVQAFSKAISVSPTALSNWRREHESSTPFRAVTIIEAASAESFVVRGPLGLSIEGLSMPALIQLLEGLGGSAC